jgi:hypothetical protein
MMQNAHCSFITFVFFLLSSISANLKNVVYCTAIRVGGQEEWDFAWQRYRKTNVGSEKDILLGALGCSREIWILSRYCSLLSLRFITAIQECFHIDNSKCNYSLCFRKCLAVHLKLTPWLIILLKKLLVSQQVKFQIL